MDFLTEPPKSIKKKVVGGDNSKGTSSKSLFISDWSNAQIFSYCGACGIALFESVNDCISHIRMLEMPHFCLLQGADGDLLGGSRELIVFINIITWNVSYLERSAKRFLVKNF